jgi:hypothetical protein
MEHEVCYSQFGQFFWFFNYKKICFKQKHTKNIFHFSVSLLGNVQITPALSSGATPAQTLVMATPTSRDLTGLTSQD